MARAYATPTAALQEALRYVVLDNGQTAASGDYHDDTITALAIAEQMRLWTPTQVEVVSMAQELGSMPLEGAMAGGDGGVDRAQQLWPCD